MAQFLFVFLWFVLTVMIEKVFSGETGATLGKIAAIVTLILAIFAIVGFFTRFNPFGITLR